MFKMEIESKNELRPTKSSIESSLPIEVAELELTPNSSASNTETEERRDNRSEDEHLKVISISDENISIKIEQDETKIDTQFASEKKESDSKLEEYDENEKLPSKKEIKQNAKDIIDSEITTIEQNKSFCDKNDINNGDSSITVGTQKEPTTIAIQATMLSPPKSESQTDDMNTTSSASTSNSTSPASDTQISPTSTVLNDNIGQNQKKTTSELVQNRKVNEKNHSVKLLSNGKFPKSGKPLMVDINKKMSKTTTRTPRIRKQKTPMVTTMYESEISDKKGGIKLCIKKSDTNFESPKSNNATSIAPSISGTKILRKRSRKSKSRPQLDSDDSEYEPKKKQPDKQKKQISFSNNIIEKEDNVKTEVDQGDWGSKLPEEVLFKIFHMVVDREGCLPTLFRLGRVCSLWRRVSLFPTLWKSLDLSTWIKEKYRTELKLKWFVDNRCSHCTDLNVANWKVSDIHCFLNKLAKGCPNLQGITLSGWKSFNCDHLTFLVDKFPKLERLDLSSVNVEMNASKSAVGLQSICNALQTMKSRLSHLYLAHNRLAAIPQIVNMLAKHCTNLALLDLSNVTTQATSHSILHIEKLQHGCPKLKVLRVTNSHISLSIASMQEQMDSPGFPELEELSVAALTHESRIICDEHLQRILKTSSKLKLLDVRGCMRLTHESLIRLPAWDIKHLFLSGCSITRDVGSGLELIASKWAHSLMELDLAWANVQQPLDNALKALAEKGAESPLAHLNLCGSSVSEDAVKEILANCPQMSSINLASCRGLPRGVKRLMKGNEIQELRDILKVQMKVKLPGEGTNNNSKQSMSIEDNSTDNENNSND